MDSILLAIENLYPQQKNSNMYRHFKMLQKRHYGDEQAALDLAKLIAMPIYPENKRPLKTAEQSFYHFYIEKSETTKANPEICEQGDDGLPGWTSYLMENQKEILIDHLFSKMLDEEIWKFVSQGYRRYYANNDDETNSKLFYRIIGGYLLYYTRDYLRNNGHSPPETGFDVDEKLSNAIAASIKYCLNN